jgi:hypothetical protein
LPQGFSAATRAGSSCGVAICGPLLTLPGAQARAVQLEHYRRYAAITDRWLDRFLDEHLLSPGADARIRGERPA